MYRKKIESRLDKIRYYDYGRLKKEILFYAKISVIIIILLLIIFGIIRIYFFIDSIDSNIFYTILNTLIYGGYFCALGFFNLGIKNNTTRFFLLLLILLLFLIGLGYLDILVYVNLPVFFYKWFSFASVEGLYFFVLNFHFWFFCYCISISLEREVGVNE